MVRPSEKSPMVSVVSMVFDLDFFPEKTTYGYLGGGFKLGCA